MRNPRGPKFTDKQEAEYVRTEAVMIRARIIECGVASILNNGEYANSNEIGVAAKMLTESVALRVDAEGIREAIRKAEREAGNPRRERFNNPRPPKAKVRTQ